MGGEANGAHGHTVRLTIPAKAEYVSLCRLALVGLARVHPVPEETLADLKPVSYTHLTLPTNREV